MALLPEIPAPIPYQHIGGLTGSTLLLLSASSSPTVGNWIPRFALLRDRMVVLLLLGLLNPLMLWSFASAFQLVSYGLLWSRGNILRSRALSSYNPFAVLPDADRELLLEVLQVNQHQVWLDDPDWQEQVEEAFKRGVSVSLIARPDAREDLKSAILGLAAEPTV